MEKSPINSKNLEDFSVDLLRRELQAIQNIRDSEDLQYIEQETRIKNECIQCRKFLSLLLAGSISHLLLPHSDNVDSLDQYCRNNLHQ